MFKAGDAVYWKDPEDITSGVYRIIKIINDDIVLIGNNYSETEVFISELKKLKT